MLRDITIENYRLFEKFQLEGLTQVNLLVGTNNSGKSSLLEAIYLLVNHEDPTVLLNVLDNRGEYILEENGDANELYQISEIFRGHKLKSDCSVIISSQQDESKFIEYAFIDYDEPSASDKFIERRVRYVFKGRDKEDIRGSFYLDDDVFTRGFSGSIIRHTNKRIITTERLNYRVITRLWNQLVLTPKEDMVLEALRILEPDVERITFLSQTTVEMSIQLKIKGKDTPVPLGSMGDGMYRVFALTLSLVNSENGVLLVDEIDTGLHYKALTKMWRLVIETAKKLNVQVFATTHSWDCLSSFQKVLTEEKAETIGSVFRLERTDNQIGYVTYSSEELAIAVEHDIEVR